MPKPNELLEEDGQLVMYLPTQLEVIFKNAIAECAKILAQKLDDDILSDMTNETTSQNN